MRRTAAVIFLTVLLALAASQSLWAVDISRLGGGARSIAVGKAYTGVYGDINSMFINPSGLSGISTFEISSMYVNYAGDVTYTMLGATYPTKFGVFGAGYLGAFSGDLAFTTEESSGRIASVGLFNYSSSIMSLSYAARPFERLSVGLSGKYYSKGSPQVDGGNGSGMSLDIGAVYALNDNLTLGLSGQNILNTGIRWDGGITENIPYDLRVGLVFVPNNKLTAMLDGEKVQGSDILMRAGIEYKLRDQLSVRVGAEQMQLGRGSSYWNYSGGVGLKFGEMELDYAYYRDTLVAENSSHFISISIGFPAIASVKPKEAVQEVRTAEAPTKEMPAVTATTPEAEEKPYIVEEQQKASEPASSGLTEQKVRDYINLLDSKIKTYKAKGNAAKVKELRKEKQKTINRWKAAQGKQTVRKPVVKKTPSVTVQEKKIKNYIKSLNSKIKKYKARGDKTKVRQLQIERQRAVDKWQEIRKRSKR